MHIITRKRLNDFVLLYPEVKTALQHWYKVMKANNFNSFNELKVLFPHADQVGKLTVFNIAGNKVRLIAAVHYNTQKIYIRNILTHNEYDKNKWKE
jgi:mRNA interferase HigB